MGSTRTVTTVGAEEGSNLSVAGNSYRIVISGDQTEGAFAVIEMLVPPGGGPNPHAHPDFQEAFYVIEGEVEVKTEGETYIAKKGSFVNIPLGGIVHCFKNKAEKNARLLCTVVPSGLEKLFEEIGEPVSFGTFLPPAPMDAATEEKLRELAEKYNQQVFPPDYLD